MRQTDRECEREGEGGGKVRDRQADRLTDRDRERDLFVGCLTSQQHEREREGRGGGETETESARLFTETDDREPGQVMSKQGRAVWAGTPRNEHGIAPSARGADHPSKLTLRCPRCPVHACSNSR